MLPLLRKRETEHTHQHTHHVERKGAKRRGRTAGRLTAKPAVDGQTERDVRVRGVAEEYKKASDETEALAYMFKAEKEHKDSLEAARA